MENLTATVLADADGFLVTLPALSLRCSRFRLPAGATYGDLAAEAERMALERWEGGIMFRLALPVGDCGHLSAPAGREPETHEQCPDNEADYERE